jgi:hypothetical protein
MNLEKDVSPTGLYNYLPKLSDPRKTRRRRKSTRRTRSRRVLRKSRTFRSKRRGGATKDELQAFLEKVDQKQLEVGQTSGEDPALVSVPSDLLTEAKRLDVVIQGTKNLGNLRNAIERAHDEAMAREK